MFFHSEISLEYPTVLLLFEEWGFKKRESYSGGLLRSRLKKALGVTIQVKK